MHQTNSSFNHQNAAARLASGGFVHRTSCRQVRNDIATTLLLRPDEAPEETYLHLATCHSCRHYLRSCIELLASRFSIGF
jgi:hypothetical protein